MESRSEDKSKDLVIMVACALIGIPDELFEGLRRDMKHRLPDVDVMKIFVDATHAHAAPVVEEGLYDISCKNIIQPKKYVQFLKELLGKLIVRAWNDRGPSAVSWGLVHAVVGQNRCTGIRQHGRLKRPRCRCSLLLSNAILSGRKGAKCSG